VQTDATFCGQCGFNLQAENFPVATPLEETAIGSSPNISLDEISLPDELPVSKGSADMLPEAVISSPIQSPWDIHEDQDDDSQTMAQPSAAPMGFDPGAQAANINSPSNTPDTDVAEVPSTSFGSDALSSPSETPSINLDLETSATESEARNNSPEIPFPSSYENVAPPAAVPQPRQAFDAFTTAGATQLQIQQASLLHLQSNTTIEIASSLDVVHFGKPNGQIPPDIDVSGFPDSEVVSRVHADIRIEGDTYYLEDTGSSNGTYVNHAPLQKGNRHRLRPGDRIALGKGDLVTFIFQLS
jgi:pSer/pThr/pTyr-binding forkhead associated (FHA) protein